MADAPFTSADIPVEDVVLGLFDQCAPRLLRYVGAFGLPLEAAEDVVQEVFLALFRHLTLGRSRKNLRGWVFRVAHNLALKQRRRLQTRERGRVSAEVQDRLEIHPQDGPEEQFVARQRRRRLQQIYLALSERDRRCLGLRAEGLPYREIARILGLSLGTVAASLAHAFAKFEVAHEK